ncbi:lysophospholipase D GDPD3a isoform X3 [Alosa sapidissima]|uniref:lysophospholipase D GDPD3a isoform X3 n=1 Tax=Alosa sapidissima TaxID=34773 RepID=UPI001C0A3555|nr:lysophospholipase D GDPD3a isoform X3 [Alosa sapidissima]
MASWLYFLVPALGGYSVASYFLLKNPHVLHRRKHKAFTCTHISHRGGCGERIESTMEAFTHAVDQGTEMLELDCHLTKDGHVVVSHDENLLRQTGHDVTISSLNFQELPLYKERLEVTFKTGEFSSGSDRKFTLLEEVFRRFPQMPVNIEVKENNPVLIDKVSVLVKQYDREQLTVWATTSSGIMKLCRDTNSSMPYMFTVSRGLQLLLLFYCGLLPFVPLGESFLQFYLPRIFNRTFLPESRILRNKVVVSLIEKLTMRKSLFDHLVKRGIQVHLFVCNTDDDIAAAFAAGATGVMSDYPTLLANYLHTHTHTHTHTQSLPNAPRQLLTHTHTHSHTYT